MRKTKKKPAQKAARESTVEGMAATSGTVGFTINRFEPNSAPVAVAVPNTSREKMECIAKLCDAIKSLATSLESVNVEVKVANNHIRSFTGAGIKIGFEPTKAVVKDNFFDSALGEPFPIRKP